MDKVAGSAASGRFYSDLVISPEGDDAPVGDLADDLYLCYEEVGSIVGDKYVSRIKTVCVSRDFVRPHEFDAIL
jgi:hypothetical protein